MRKILLFTIFGILLLAGSLAFIVQENGDILLNGTEFSEVTNQQIANHLDHNLVMTRYVKTNEKLIPYYNLTYIEPTHDENNSYRVFTQEKGFPISLDLWNQCLNITTIQNCKNILVDRDTPFIYHEGEEDELTIYSTYYKATQEQARQYERAKTFRDKLNYNELDQLEALL